MTYLAVLYRLAVAGWLGGAALFTFVLTPALFRELDRDTAGSIVGILFPGYFRWGLACGVIALACLLLTRPPRLLASAIIIVAMLVVTSLQAFVIEPKAAALKQEIPSFVTTPVDHPLRQQFMLLHAFSAAGNLGVIGGGIALILLL
ncbi:MAG: DUF4149 domain-containing protein [Desulfuromonas sp.]|nr:DUF4149 domain-containing protein [Desulfuromonas sp.]